MRSILVLMLLAASVARGAAARAPQAGSSVELNGAWQLVAVDGALTPLPGWIEFVAPAAPFVDNPPQGMPNNVTVRADAGCNYIFTFHMVRPVDALRFAPANSTLMLCDDNAVNLLEYRFMTRMNSTAQYQISGSGAKTTLTLRDATGRELLRFSRAGLVRVYAPLIAGR